MFDVEKIREDFPILSREISGRPLIYLDNGATSQTPKCVVDHIADTYYRVNANVHRGVHTLSQEATDAHEAARRRVQQFIGAGSSSEIIFTRGTTEAINLVASSFGDEFLHDGDEVILTVMEHHANIVPWQLLQRRRNIKLRVVPIDERGDLNVDTYKSLFAHARGFPVLVDGAQAVPHLRVNVQELDADFYVFSAHKVYGPTGIGVLYGKEKWLDAMPPYQGGGEMIAHVDFSGTTFGELPFKFEAGTPDYVGTSAFATALDYVDHVGLESIAAHENELLRYTTDRLQDIEGMRIFGTSEHKSSVISFLVDGIHHYDMGILLDKLGVAVRTGHHCAQPLMTSLGIEGTVRASFAAYNTKAEAEAFVAAVKRVVQMFR